MNRIKMWFRSLGSKMQSFMYGRYGVDELNSFLSVGSLIFIVLDLFLGTGIFSGLGIAMWLYSIFRMYSKKHDKRHRELEAYQKLAGPVKSWWHLCRRKWSDRKTHRYYKCSQCKTSMRVPKGKGKIKIHCPNCGAETIKKT